MADSSFDNPRSFLAVVALFNFRLNLPSSQIVIKAGWMYDDLHTTGVLPNRMTQFLPPGLTLLMPVAVSNCLARREAHFQVAAQVRKSLAVTFWLAGVVASRYLLTWFD